MMGGDGGELSSPSPTPSTRSLLFGNKPANASPLPSVDSPSDSDDDFLHEKPLLQTLCPDLLQRLVDRKRMLDKINHPERGDKPAADDDGDGDESKRESAPRTQCTAVRKRLIQLLLHEATLPNEHGDPTHEFKSRGPRSYFALDGSLGTPLDTPITSGRYLVLFNRTKTVVPINEVTVSSAVDALSPDRIRAAIPHFKSRSGNAKKSDRELAMGCVAEELDRQLGQVVDGHEVEVEVKAKLPKAMIKKGTEPLPVTAEIMDVMREWSLLQHQVATTKQKRSADKEILDKRIPASDQEVLAIMQKHDIKSQTLSGTHMGKQFRVNLVRKVRKALVGVKPKKTWVKSKCLSILQTRASKPLRVRLFLSKNEDDRSAFREALKAQLMDGLAELATTVRRPEQEVLCIETPRKPAVRGSTRRSSASTGQDSGDDESSEEVVTL